MGEALSNVVLLFVECTLEAGGSQFTYLLGGDEMLCAPGTIFNLTECVCVNDPNPYTCKSPIVLIVCKSICEQKKTCQHQSWSFTTDLMRYVVNMMSYVVFVTTHLGSTRFKTLVHKLCLFEDGPP